MTQLILATLLILGSAVFSLWVMDQTVHGLLPHLYEAVFP